MLIDYGQPWHKDDMLDEPDIPGITVPNYDEHPMDACLEAWKDVEGIDEDVLPF